MDTALGVIGGLSYLCVSLLTGGLIFQLWIVPGVQRKNNTFILRSRHYLKNLLYLATAIFFSSFLFTASNISDSWNVADLGTVAVGTSFGLLSLIKLGIVIVLAGTNSSQVFSKMRWMIFFLPVLVTLSGHAAASPELRMINVPLDLIHFTAVSIWTGGVLGLIFWLRDWKESSLEDCNERLPYKVVSRFSRSAVIATALVAVSGLTLAWRYDVSFTAPWETAYGKVVVLKLALFLGTLSAAAVNHFVYLKRWQPHQNKSFVWNVYRQTQVEFTLILLIFLAAGFLTRLPPPQLSSFVLN